MKSYTITVNGNVYDVTVEENTNGAAAPVARKAAPVAPKAAPAAAPKAAGAAGGIKVAAGAVAEAIAPRVMAQGMEITVGKAR